MTGVKAKFPWQQSEQRRPYADSLSAVLSVAGMPDGVVYERIRKEKLITEIVGNGHGLHWQISSDVHNGYLESLSVGQGMVLNLTHMRSSKPHPVSRAKDSYVCIGVAMNGAGINPEPSLTNPARSLAFIGAANQAELLLSGIPGNNSYIDAVTLLLPYQQAESLPGEKWPVIQSIISTCIATAEVEGHSREIRPVSQYTQRFIHDILYCPFKGVIRHEYMRSKCQELFCHISELFSGPAVPLGISQAEREAVLLARSQLVANLKEPPSTEELVMTSGLTKETLVKGFKLLFEKTPRELLQSERMSRSEKLLLETDMSVDEIAAALGYYSSSSLIRAFKAKNGITPKKFRSL